MQIIINRIPQPAPRKLQLYSSTLLFAFEIQSIYDLFLYAFVCFCFCKQKALFELLVNLILFNFSASAIKWNAFPHFAWNLQLQFFYQIYYRSFSLEFHCYLI